MSVVHLPSEAHCSWRKLRCVVYCSGQPPRLVSVPTHYYKVVLAENNSKQHGPHSAAVGAFVMPNAPIDPKIPVTAFVVPIEALESVAGDLAT